MSIRRRAGEEQERSEENDGLQRPDPRLARPVAALEAALRALEELDGQRSEIVLRDVDKGRLDRAVERVDGEAERLREVSRGRERGQEGRTMQKTASQSGSISSLRLCMTSWENASYSFRNVGLWCTVPGTSSASSGTKEEIGRASCRERVS